MSAPRAVPPYLSGEVTDRIISLVTDYGSDGFHSDHQTLLACALVCQDWLPSSRTALFRGIRLASKAAYGSFVEHVLHAERLNPYLRSTRVLIIHKDNEYPEGGPPWSHTFVHDFAGHFPNVEHLRMSQVDWWSQPPHPSAHLAISRFTSLSRLELWDCMLPSWHILRTVVMALSPSLTFLDLHHVHCPEVSPNPDAPINIHPAPSILHELKYYGGGQMDSCDPFFRWLSHAHKAHSSLRRLTFARGGEPTASYTPFFKAIVSGLTELYLQVTLALLREFPFHELKSLQKLRVSLINRNSGESYWDDLSRLLPDIPSRPYSLQFHMRMQVDMATGDLDDVDGLELLDAVLQDDTYKDLEQAVFLLPVPSDIPESKRVDLRAGSLAVVRRKLPIAVSRGIVIITDGYEYAW